MISSAVARENLGLISKLREPQKRNSRRRDSNSESFASEANAVSISPRRLARAAQCPFPFSGHSYADIALFCQVIHLLINVCGHFTSK